MIAYCIQTYIRLSSGMIACRTVIFLPKQSSWMSGPPEEVQAGISHLNQRCRTLRVLNKRTTGISQLKRWSRKRRSPMKPGLGVHSSRCDIEDLDFEISKLASFHSPRKLSNTASCGHVRQSGEMIISTPTPNGPACKFLTAGQFTGCEKMRRNGYILVHFSAENATSWTAEGS